MLSAMTPMQKGQINRKRGFIVRCLQFGQMVPGLNVTKPQNVDF